MSTRVTETIIAVYGDPGGADAAIARLRRFEGFGIIDVAGVAVLTKSADQRLTVQELDDLSANEDQQRSALLGAVVGLIFPPSLFTSVLAGNGDANGGLSGTGIRSEALEEIGRRLQDAHSTIVIVLDSDRAVEHVLDALDGHEQLYRQTLDSETLQALRQVS
jgi:uncharacterized membrane protein